MAIIKAHGNDFRTLTLGDSARLQVGEEVVAIGNPLSLESTVSNGIVSAIRTVEEEGGKFLQITAPISHGSSGGPLFNMAGEVVGITSAVIVGGENLNFAIPIDDVKPMLRATFSAVSALPNEPEDKQTSTEQGPDFKATIDFMRKMVEPTADSSDMTLNNPLASSSTFPVIQPPRATSTFLPDIHELQLWWTASSRIKMERKNPPIRLSMRCNIAECLWGL